MKRAGEKAGDRRYNRRRKRKTHDNRPRPNPSRAPVPAILLVCSPCSPGLTTIVALVVVFDLDLRPDMNDASAPPPPPDPLRFLFALGAGFAGVIVAESSTSSSCAFETWLLSSTSDELSLLVVVVALEREDRFELASKKTRLRTLFEGLLAAFHASKPSAVVGSKTTGPELFFVSDATIANAW